MLSASHPWPPLLVVTFLTTDTKKLLTKKPRERVVKKRPVLMVFIPLGDCVMKKSSWPVYMNASPAPTRKNCGIRRKTLMGRLELEDRLTDFATDSLFVSANAAAAIPIMDSTSPMAILCKLEKPEPRPSHKQIK